MGRGVLFRGRFAEPDDAGLPASPPRPRTRIGVPFTMPNWLLNKATTRLFNFGIYTTHMAKRGIVHPEDFFYPLDKIRNWNRIYGARGMAQYQCVLPKRAGTGAARRMLEFLTSGGGAGSFLCVIKDCGPEGKGMLSFPFEGFSIALDIPVDDRVQEVHDRLNEAVLAEGGRMYLTKDGYTRPEHFRAMYPRLPEFLQVKRKWDPDNRFRSAQSVRILGERP
jgi:FAD/FMN-containing dehydrogenase